MYTISDTVHINAPIDRCFLLATNIELVSLSLNMRLLGREAKGLVAPDDRLLWHGWKFGLPQIHETMISAYDRPHFFQDSMRRGRFKRYQHEHSFAEIDGHTLLHDKIRFSLPLGLLGAIAAKRVMVPYIARLLHSHLQLLKRIAETDEWCRYLPDEPAESS